MESVVGPVHLLALVCTDRAVTNYSDGRLLKRPQNRVVRVAFCTDIVWELPQEQYSRKRIVDGRPVHEKWSFSSSSFSPALMARAPRLLRYAFWVVLTFLEEFPLEDCGA